MILSPSTIFTNGQYARIHAVTSSAQFMSFHAAGFALVDALLHVGTEHTQAGDAMAFQWMP